MPKAIGPAAVMEVSDPRRAEYIKQELIRLNRALSGQIMDTGRLLREYKGGGYYKEEGHASFDEAIEAWKDQGLIDFGARQARNLIAIVDMVEAICLTPAEINELGISKLREIASIKDLTEQRKLLEEAKSKPFSEIQKLAKGLRDKQAGRDEDPLDPVTLLMTETQKKFYKDCIDRARMIGGITEVVPDVAVLVDVILADWFSGAPDLPEQFTKKKDNNGN